MGDCTLIVGPYGVPKIAVARELARFCGKPEETAADRSYIYRVAGLEHPGLVTSPFRAPHHTCSAAALLGGVSRGYAWRPGELSLAHGGTLLLDEVTEFSRRSLELVRGVFDRGVIVLCAAGGRRLTVPARFNLIATACPDELDRVPEWLRERARIVKVEKKRA
jgi:magnesium chelatase family protein